MSLSVRHDLRTHQFIALVENKECVLKYHPLDDHQTLDFVGTYVPAELRGRHIAQDLVKFALEYAKENHFKVIPTCSFVKKYIEGHTEYQNLHA